MIDDKLKEDINNIVWWIPIKKLRNSLRNILLKFFEYNNNNNNNNLIDEIYSNTVLLAYKLNVDNYNKPYVLSVMYNNKKIFFHAEEMQDFIAFTYLKNIKKNFGNGFFIEIGAHDGISGSTTKVFESIGWNGICVEPNPNLFKKLIENRSCDCINAAISSENIEFVKFINILNNGSFRSFLAFGLSDEDIKIKLNNIQKAIYNKLNKYDKLDIEELYVNVQKFKTILDNYKEINHIDFMSIDVEGGEYNIVKTIDFAKYTFSCVTIESHSNEVRDVFIRNGYKLLCSTTSDDIFVKK